VFILFPFLLKLLFGLPFVFISQVADGSGSPVVLEGHSGEVASLAFDPHNALAFATISDDLFVRFWLVGWLVGWWTVQLVSKRSHFSCCFTIFLLLLFFGRGVHRGQPDVLRCGVRRQPSSEGVRHFQPRSTAPTTK
jgi:hypothetical protein